MAAAPDKGFGTKLACASGKKKTRAEARVFLATRSSRYL